MNSGLKIVAEWAEASGTSLYTLVAGRIARHKAPSSFENTQACVVIHGQAMGSEIKAPVQNDRYVFKCYGGTHSPEDAEAVFEAVFDRFHDVRGDTTAGGIVRSTFETGSATDEPAEGGVMWPVYIATFEILTT